MTGSGPSTDLSLVVMAAGLGSRFGGAKQLARVGPDGEAFLDFAIADAAAAGVAHTVLVVRSDIEADVRRHVEVRHGHRDIVYVRQDENGPRRVKPWGTAHAVLAAAEAVDGPFLVCNADDYYGAGSYAAVSSAASGLADDEAVLAGFRLELTLPASGSVSRGICTLDGDRLASVVEHRGITRVDDGSIAATHPAVALDADSVASMNLWLFPRAIFDRLERDFAVFVESAADDDEAEFLLPTVVTDMMADGELSVRVVAMAEPWVGVTRPEDLEAARALIASVRGVS